MIHSSTILAAECSCCTLGHSAADTSTAGHRKPAARIVVRARSRRGFWSLRFPLASRHTHPLARSLSPDSLPRALQWRIEQRERERAGWVFFNSEFLSGLLRRSSRPAAAFDRFVKTTGAPSWDARCIGRGVGEGDDAHAGDIERSWIDNLKDESGLVKIDLHVAVRRHRHAINRGAKTV